MNLLASFKHCSSLYFLPPSSQPRTQLQFSTSLQHASTPSSKHRKLTSPNLIHEEIPLLLSQIQPFSFPLISSTKISNNLESTTDQLLPPLATSSSPRITLIFHPCVCQRLFTLLNVEGPWIVHCFSVSLKPHTTHFSSSLTGLLIL